MRVLLAIPVLVLFWQWYNYALLQKGEAKQKACRNLGIFSFTLGVFFLFTRIDVAAVAGLIAIMFAFRFLAHSLDRLDKKTYIDRPPPSGEEGTR